MITTPTMEIAPMHAMLPTPALVAYAGLLALPGPELDEAVARELDANPALVLDDDLVTVSAHRQAASPIGTDDADGSWAEVWPLDRGRSDGPRPVAEGLGLPQAARANWREQLITDLRLEVSTSDAEIATLVVGCLDEHGYLADDPVALGEDRGYEAASVARVLDVLRTTSSPGVGARDVRQCLALQLDRMPDGDRRTELARAIVGSHLKALASGRVQAIGDALGVDVAAVDDAREYIVTRLRPHPDLDAGSMVGSSGTTGYVRPDVAIVTRPGAPDGLDVEVLETRRFAIRVDADLRMAAREPGNERMSELVRRADFFMDRLRERWATLRRVTSCVARRQRGFLEDGPIGALPLTRAEVARDLGIHESTVSRAVAGKYVLLPSRRVIPLAALFDRSTGVRGALRAILDNEPGPLTDAELCERLRRSGHVVARRTVAKYRDLLGVPPSTRRAVRAASANRDSCRANRASPAG